MTPGQNISLPCTLSKKDAKIIQIQWHKEGENGEQKLVVFNPSFPAVYLANITLELVNDKNTNNLRGSILHLQEVTEKDSGVYVCEIASFPDGNIKSFTKVQLTGKFIKYLIRDGTVCKKHTFITIQERIYSQYLTFYYHRIYAIKNTSIV